MLGIKLADGAFFPILQEGGPGSKKVLLTTMRDDQESVHIDIYRGSPDSSVDSAERIVGLVLEDLPRDSGRAAEVELSLSLDDKFNLSATAREISTGEYQSLRINLEFPEKDGFALPDIDVKPPAEASDSRAAGLRPNGIAAAAFVVFGFLILAVLIYIVFRYLRGTPAPSLRAAAIPVISALRRV